MRTVYEKNANVAEKSGLCPYGYPGHDREEQRPAPDNFGIRANYASYTWANALREHKEAGLPKQEKRNFW